MIQFYKKHPYIIIYSIVVIFSGLLFGWGKIFRDLEWYLDKVNMVIAALISLIGIALFIALWYFRYHNESSTQDLSEKE